MNKRIDVTEPDGPEIQESLLLKFLIKRCNDVLDSDRPMLPISLQGLGFAALDGNEQLSREFRDILSSEGRSPDEIIRGAIEILKIALDETPAQYSDPGTKKDYHELGGKACRHVMMAAIREAKIMLHERDYRFLKVFECLGWMSLQCESEWLAEFERVRNSFVNDPEALIEAGRDILRDALFRRRPSGRVRLSHN